MKSKIQILLLLFITSQLFPQNLDSLYTELLIMRNKVTTDELPAKVHNEDELHNHNHKCAVGLIKDIKRNYAKFTAKQQAEINVLLSRPQLPKSVLSPSGKFRIHYDDTDGSTDELGYDLNEFVQACDDVYHYEVETLGYNSPPTDADDVYDVYLMNLSSSYYGYTETETEIGNSGRYTCFIVLDNDFSPGYATEGLDAAKVTIAHEFHHYIQLGAYYDNYYEDSFYYELSAVAMEEFNYDEINDYYSYLSPYFNSPDNALDTFSGYELGIFNMFLQEQYDHDLLKKIWENIANRQRALEAVDNALKERGSNFRDIYNRFGIWTFFTGERANATLYFEEGRNYPEIEEHNYNLTNGAMQLELTMNPASNVFLTFNDAENNKEVTSVFTNGDVDGAINNSGSSSFNYSLFNYSNDNLNPIGEGYYAGISNDDNNFAVYSHVLTVGNQSTLLVPGAGEIELDDFVYPLPFVYSEHGEDAIINIPSSYDSDGTAELYVYSTSMSLVFNDKLSVVNTTVQRNGNTFQKLAIEWKPRTNSGDKLASGVYIYVIKVNDDIKKGKLVIING